MERGKDRPEEQEEVLKVFLFHVILFSLAVKVILLLFLSSYINYVC